MINFHSEIIENIIADYQPIIDEIINEIKNSRKIAVMGHANPDGDIIGATLALVKSLNQNGFQIHAINEGPFDNLFLNQYSRLFYHTIDQDYDLYIIIDTPNRERLGLYHTSVQYERAIIIDHHVTNAKYGKINWVDDNFLSSSEMIFLLLFRIGFGLKDQDVCQLILNGIMMDNGFYNHITREKNLSLLISYFLIEYDADPRLSYHLMFMGKSLASKKILALIFERLSECSNGRIIWTYITADDRQLFDNPMIDTAIVFREIMSIDNVEIAIYFKAGKEKTEISFRSTGRFNVAALAKMFKGGGHFVAAGCTLTGNFEDIREEVVKKACEFVSLEQKDS